MNAKERNKKERERRRILAQKRLDALRDSTRLTDEDWRIRIK